MCLIREKRAQWDGGVDLGSLLLHPHPHLHQLHAPVLTSQSPHLASVEWVEYLPHPECRVEPDETSGLVQESWCPASAFVFAVAPHLWIVAASSASSASAAEEFDSQQLHHSLQSQHHHRLCHRHHLRRGTMLRSCVYGQVPERVRQHRSRDGMKLRLCELR